MLCRIVDSVFEDKRIASVLLITWLCTVVAVFKQLGMFDSAYMNFGPSPKTVFMTVVLDTWYRWGLVAWFTFINTCMNDFFSDAISPWLLNTVIDHKARYLNYPKLVCLLISQVWSVYCAVMGVLGLMVALSQIDFVLIRLLADLVVNTYTNLKFMQGKTYDPAKYYNLDAADRGPHEMQSFTISEDDLEDRG
jgi:hypothetical protein